MRFTIVLAVVALAGCDHRASHSNPDAPPVPDAPVGATFSCGTATCNADTQYCYEFQAGVDGAPPSVGCNDLPLACRSAHTCDCVIANTTSPCALSAQCSVQGLAVTVICQGI